MYEEVRKTFAKNLRYYLDRNSYTQADMSRYMKVSTATASDWCNGYKMPRTAKIQSLCNWLGVELQDLLTDSSSAAPVDRWIRIPVLGRIAAGVPLEAVRDIQGEVEISPEMQRRGDLFAFRIKGDSMEPKISDGDVVIARQQEDAEDGQLVVALVNGNDACCKRIKKYKDGIALVSTNPAYPPMYFSQAEIDTVPVQVIGVVLELRAPL